jgi:hypothetical protein
MTALGVLTLGACQQEKVTEGEKVIPLELLITNTSHNVVYPTVKELNLNTQELHESVSNYCDELDDLKKSEIKVSNEHYKNMIDFMRLKPQKKWKAVMSQFHRYEIMQYGPVKSPLSTTMSSLYTFDTSHKCKVVINISRDRTPNFNITDEEDYKLIGLDAVEALLFTDLNKSLCPRDLPWDSKPVLDKQIESCKYTKQLTKAITLKADELENDWSIEGSDFNSQILTANALGSNENAVNQVSQALFLLYGGIVDAKVTVPAGIQVFNDRLTTCEEKCHEKTEHQYSGQSIESMISALEGFYYLFNGINPESGQNGISFDDLLVAQHNDHIVNGINSALNDAIANYKKHIGIKSLTDLSKNVDKEKCQNTTSKNRLVEICALNKDVEIVTDYLLQMEVLLKGILSRPTSQQGDND